MVDELEISTAPLVLGGGKRLFEGFEQDLDLGVTGPRRRPIVRADRLNPQACPRVHYT